MPYIALQLFGIQVSIAQLGFPVEISLIIAFLILAAYTYTSGLRAPAMIALVKDVMVLTVVLVAIIYIPTRLGGFSHIFSTAIAYQKVHNPKFHALLAPAQLVAFSTLALGSAFALFLYPHSITGTLSSNSRNVIKRNTALLPIYSLMLGLLALLGFMALALPHPPASSNNAVPTLISAMFPSWFAGFAFAAISIGALVPAAVMSIAAANLFTRNIYKEYFHRNASDREEATVAKLTSLVVKIGALVFILFLPTTNIIQFQLLGGIWILQTFPSVFLGLYTNWFHRWALTTGLIVGFILGTVMAVSQNFGSVFPFKFGGTSFSVYSAVIAVIVNLILAVVLTPVFRAMGIPSGQDVTSPADYEAAPEAKEPVPEALG
jgi:SSS family solute:Na+ symporter